MSRNLQIVAARPPLTSVSEDFILAPFIAGIAPAHRELVGLLPVGDVNEATLKALKDRPVGKRAIAGLVLVDPFLRLRDVKRALEQAGVTRISNYPTIQLIDGETARAFDSARAGVEREIEMMAAFRDAGFGIVAFATTLHTAQAMLHNGASTLVLHPGLALSDWRERANAGLGLARMIPTLREQSDVPLLVYRPNGFGHELDQAMRLADGMARMGAEASVE